MPLARRLVFAAPLLLAVGKARAAPPAIRAFVNPGCECCQGWATHLRGAGFTVTTEESTRLDALRQAAGVPPDLAGCHFARLGDFILEGHVPAAAIRRFLAAPARWRGLAVPGMPSGSPGMEMPGQSPETYAVIAFDAAGRDPSWAMARGAALL